MFSAQHDIRWSNSTSDQPNECAYLVFIFLDTCFSECFIRLCSDIQASSHLFHPSQGNSQKRRTWNSRGGGVLREGVHTDALINRLRWQRRMLLLLMMMMMMMTTQRCSRWWRWWWWWGWWWWWWLSWRRRRRRRRRGRGRDDDDDDDCGGGDGGSSVEDEDAHGLDENQEERKQKNLKKKKKKSSQAQGVHVARARPVVLNYGWWPMCMFCMLSSLTVLLSTASVPIYCNSLLMNLRKLTEFVPIGCVFPRNASAFLVADLMEHSLPGFF